MLALPGWPQPDLSTQAPLHLERTGELNVSSDTENGEISSVTIASAIGTVTMASVPIDRIKEKTRIQKLQKIQSRLAELLIPPSTDPEDEDTAGNSEIKIAMSCLATAITEILIQENTHIYELVSRRKQN